MFLVPQVSVKFGIGPSLKLLTDQFSLSSLEMYGFSPFNQDLIKFL